MLELTRAHLDDNDVAGAAQLFAETKSLVDNESFGVDGRQWLARTGIALALAAGDLTSAASWSQQIEDSFWGPIDAARVELAAGARSEASAALAAAARAVLDTRSSLPYCWPKRLTIPTKA